MTRGPQGKKSDRGTGQHTHAAIENHKMPNLSVTHYYSHLSVATLRLEPGTTLRVGGMIHIRGHTTDFSQRVESLEVNHAPATDVRPNDDFGLKVVEHAREHDVVYKVRS